MGKKNKLIDAIKMECLDSMGIPFLIVDAGSEKINDPCVIFINKDFSLLSGYDSSDVVDEKLSLFYKISGIDGIEPFLKDVINSHRAVNVKCLLSKKCGSSDIVEIEIRPIVNDAGLYEYFIILQKAQDNLIDCDLKNKDIIRRNHLLIDNFPALVGYWDKDLNNVFSNKNYEKWFGKKGSPVVGEHIKVFMGEKLYDSLCHHLVAVLNGEPQRFEANYGLKKDSIIQYATTEYIPDCVNGKVVGFYVVALDISDHKIRQAEFAMGESKLAALFNLSRLGIALNDMQGRFIEFNESFRLITGYTEAQLREINYWQLTPKEYQEAELLQLKNLDEKGYYGPYEKEYQLANGRRVPVLLNGVKIEDLNGKEFIWSIVEDISSRKEIEKNIRQAKESAELLAMIRSDFLANMSHEIRTPVNAISGLCKLALNCELSIESRDYLEKMTDACHGLLDILNDILDFSKLESGKLIIKKSFFRLDNLIREIEGLFCEAARQKGLLFIITIDPSTPLTILGDEGRLRQVLNNLISNAIKFTHAGTVELIVSHFKYCREISTIRFKVKDSGVGIAKINIERLFDPFFQVDTMHKNIGGGTGLGLAISNELLRLMGSKFDVLSTPGQGTCFTFDVNFKHKKDVQYLKSEHELSEANYSKPTQAGYLEIELESLGSQVNGKRVLIVEDNLISQMLMRKFFSFAKIIFDVVSDGNEALDALVLNDYDIVVMDMHMPNMNGIDLTKKMRISEQYKHIPILALSAGVTEQERIHCIEAGVDAFLAKPVDPKLLILEICNLMNKSD